MKNNIPILNGNGSEFQQDPGAFLEFATKLTQGSSSFRNDRDRPYDGQPWTTNGTRGKTQVEGLTIRDIRDCYIRALLTCSPDEVINQKVKDETWTPNDCYGWDLNKVDPIAVAQNLTCNIERMMGIYPNTKESPTAEELVKELINPENLIG